MQTILLIGEDAMLLHTRAAVLRKTGAEVLMSNAAHSPAIMAEHCADVVVLCHSLSEEKRYGLAKMIRSHWPRTRILLVTTHNEVGVDEQMPVDAISPTDPERLIASSRRLLMQMPPARDVASPGLHAVGA